MAQETINERLKNLITLLGLSARAFSIQLGVPDTNTRNYLDRGTKLNSDYLERIANQFQQVNLNWLITGIGSPFADDTSTQNRTDVSGNSNNVASGKHGRAIQKNYNLSDCEKERDNYKNRLDAAQREIELLTGQVQMQRTIIEGKDQMLDLLKGSINRPN